MEANPKTGISYSYAFRRCTELHRHPRVPLDPLDGEDESIDDDLEDAGEQPDMGSQPTFAELAARTGRNDRGIDGHHADLGSRPIDEIYDCHASDPISRGYGEALEFDAALKEAPDVVRSRTLTAAFPAASVRPDGRPLRGCSDRSGTHTDAGSRGWKRRPTSLTKSRIWMFVKQLSCLLTVSPFGTSSTKLAETRHAQNTILLCNCTPTCMSPRSRVKSYRMTST
jgi:hypothetical protein